MRYKQIQLQEFPVLYLCTPGAPGCNGGWKIPACAAGVVKKSHIGHRVRNQRHAANQMPGIGQTER